MKTSNHEIEIESYPDGDWVIRSKHTGFIQIPRALIDKHTPFIKPRSERGVYVARPDGWPLTHTDADGNQVTTIYRSRREYREARRCL